MVCSSDGFTNLFFMNPDFFSPNLLLVLIPSKHIVVWESKLTKKCQNNDFFLLPKYFAKNTITNRQFRICENKIRETTSYDQNLLLKLVTNNIILSINYQLGHSTSLDSPVSILLRGASLSKLRLLSSSQLRSLS